MIILAVAAHGDGEALGVTGQACGQIAPGLYEATVMGGADGAGEMQNRMALDFVNGDLATGDAAHDAIRDEAPLRPGGGAKIFEQIGSHLIAAQSGGTEDAGEGAAWHAEPFVAFAGVARAEPAVGLSVGSDEGATCRVELFQPVVDGGKPAVHQIDHSALMA